MPPACRLRYWPFLLARGALGRAPLVDCSYSLPGTAPTCVSGISRVCQEAEGTHDPHWALPSAPTRIPRAATRGRGQTAPGCELHPGRVCCCRWRRAGAPVLARRLGHSCVEDVASGDAAVLEAGSFKQRGGGGRWVLPRPLGRGPGSRGSFLAQPGCTLPLTAGTTACLPPSVGW